MVRIIALVLLFVPEIVLGQEWDFGPLRRLPNAVNGEHEDILPMQTLDGKTLFFARAASTENVGGKFAGTDVWVSNFNESSGTWSAAQNLNIFNDRGTNAVIGISDNGDEVFLVSTTGTKRAEGIYRSTKQNDTWTDPKLITVPGLSTEDFFGAYVSPDMSVIIFSMNGEESRGNEDLYISLKNAKGEWTKPRNLGSTINTSGFEMAPFLTPDKRRLYFSSNGHPGYGNADIFYSDRLYESWEVWSAPKNLGLKINSPAFESFFSIYHDTVAFFSSDRNRDYCDIYRVSVFPLKGEDEVEEYVYLSDQDVRKVSGVVFDPVLNFAPNVSDLSADHRATLKKINDGFVAKKDIKLRIIATKSGSGNLDTYQKRLLNILDYLKEAGIEGNRIVFAVEQIDAPATEKEPVTIKFYK